MVDALKDLEKHMETASQIYHNIESVQEKIEGLEEWNNFEKNVPSDMSMIKSYDIILHTLATNECQELVSKFEERFKQSIAGIMQVYIDNVQDMHEDIQWLEIDLKCEQSVPFYFF